MSERFDTVILGMANGGGAAADKLSAAGIGGGPR